MEGGRVCAAERLGGRSHAGAWERGKLAQGFGYCGFMTSFHEFLTGLLKDGRVVFRSESALTTGRGRRISRFWKRLSAFSGFRWPGRRFRLTRQWAYSAAELVRQASWALVNHDDRVSHLKKCLTMPIEPVTPAHHLSADLDAALPAASLKRARGLDPTDPLIVAAGRRARRWPLSGVLSDVARAPLGSLDFGGHPGLLLLYAERLAANDRAAWRPAQNGAGLGIL